MSEQDVKPENVPENPPRAENLTAPRFEKGKSANPGGRPKSLPRHRRKNRRAAGPILDAMMDAIEHPEKASRPLPELVRAYEVVCAMGGYLPADKEFGNDVSQGRLLLLAMAIKGLTKDQRAILIGGLERQLLSGEIDVVPR